MGGTAGLGVRVTGLGLGGGGRGEGSGELTPFGLGEPGDRGGDSDPAARPPPHKGDPTPGPFTQTRRP